MLENCFFWRYQEILAYRSKTAINQSSIFRKEVFRSISVNVRRTVQGYEWRVYREDPWETTKSESTCSATKTSSFQWPSVFDSRSSSGSCKLQLRTAMPSAYYPEARQAPSGFHICNPYPKTYMPFMQDLRSTTIPKGIQTMNRVSRNEGAPKCPNVASESKNVAYTSLLFSVPACDECFCLFESSNRPDWQRAAE